MLISENNIEDHNLRFKSLAKKLETTLKYFSTDNVQYKLTDK